MRFSTHFKVLAAAVILTTSLFSCTKKSDYKPIEVSGLSIIHAVPTAEKLNVFLDGKQATMEDFSFGNKIDYLSAYSGSRKVEVTKKGSTTVLKTETFTLAAQIGYSLFVIDNLADVKFLMLTDDLSRPATGKAKVRFVNLSPDAGPVSLAVDGAANNLFVEKAFKESTPFSEIVAAPSVTFNVVGAGLGGNQVRIADVKIEEGKIYTIYVKGLVAAADETKVSASLFVHK